MAGHIIDKDNTLQALGKINSLLEQSLEIIKMVNEDEQWDFCTSSELAYKVRTADNFIKEISKIVFESK